MPKIFPYIVTADYPIDVKTGRSKPIGNNLYLEYVRDMDNMVGSLDVSKEAIPDKIRSEAIANLKEIFKTEIKAARFPDGPNGQPFILIGNHWSAAAQLLNPDLYELAQKNLSATHLVAAIPHRDALLIFPKFAKFSAEKVKQFVREKETDGRKMLTFELFELGPDGIRPL